MQALPPNAAALCNALQTAASPSGLAAAAARPVAAATWTAASHALGSARCLALRLGAALLATPAWTLAALRRAVRGAWRAAHFPCHVSPEHTASAVIGAYATMHAAMALPLWALRQNHVQLGGLAARLLCVAPRVVMLVVSASGWAGVPRYVAAAAVARVYVQQPFALLGAARRLCGGRREKGTGLGTHVLGCLRAMLVAWVAMGVAAQLVDMLVDVSDAKCVAWQLARLFLEVQLHGKQINVLQC